MKRASRNSLIIAAAISFALCALPIMSATYGDMEECILIVRGYNVVEFSAWGCISLFAPLIIPSILMGNQSSTVQEIELRVLFLGSAVSYVYSFNAAREWLSSNCESLITYHFGMIMYPVALVALFILGGTFAALGDADAGQQLGEERWEG